MARKITALFFFLLVSFPSFATHINGMETRYLYTGQTSNNYPKYRFIVGAYMDCMGAASSPFLAYSAPFPSTLPITLSFSNSSTCSPTQIQPDWSLISWKVATPLCPSTTNICHTASSPINGRVYVESFMDVVFNCPGISTYDYAIRWCCTVSNTTSGLDDIDALAGGTIFPASHNSSPAVPPATELSMCPGVGSQFDLSVTDTSANAIRYEIVPVYDFFAPAGFITATYGVGYSATNPMGPSYTVSIDTISGVLSVTPNNSNAGHEYGLIGIKTTEFNTGKPPESTIRFVGINTIACDTSNMPILGSQGPPDKVDVTVQSGAFIISDTIFYCAGQAITTEITVGDPDAGNTVDMISDYATLPGATFSVLPGNPAKAFLTWTPAANQDSTFSVFVQAFDDYCVAPDTSSRLIHYSKYQGGDLIAVYDSSICGGPTGAAKVTMSKIFGPVAYQWFDGTVGDSIGNLVPGDYAVTISDLGCPGTTWQDEITIPEKNLLVQNTIGLPGCFANNGSISVQPSGGIPPYTYSWNNGFTGPTLFGLAPGGYQIVVSDVNGCSASTAILLQRDSNCSVGLSGVTFIDVNGNCIRDSLEPTASYIPLALSDGQQLASNWNGEFSFLSNQNNLTLSLPSLELWSPVCGIPSWNYTFTYNYEKITGIEVPISLPNQQDLEVNMVWSGALSAFSQTDIITHVANNAGDTATQVKLVTTYPAGVSLLGFNPAPDTIDNQKRQVIWNPGSMAPGENRSFYYTCRPKPSTSPGTQLLFRSEVIPISNDSLPLNNRDSTFRTVLGPYDPNSKESSPRGIGEEGYFSPEDGKLAYTVRFQNTGNYPATYVFLRDTLSNHLSFTGYKHLGSSHQYVVSLEEDSILVFTFENIGLPDSTSDPEGSIGYVMFELVFDPLLTTGTEINNQVAIYFDFNPPIFTNITRNTIYRDPTASIKYDLTGINTLCEGDSLYGTVTEGLPPYSWIWSTGQTIISDSQISYIEIPFIPQGEIITLSVTDKVGTVATDSSMLSPTNLPIAAYSFPPQSKPLEISFQNDSEYATDFFWEFGDGSTSTVENPTHVFPLPGTYLVKLVSHNDCGNSSFDSFVNVLTTSITSDINSQAVHAWYERYSEEILVRNEASQSFNLHLTDLNGRTILTERVHTGISRLPTTSLASGIYFLSGETPSGFFRTKLEIVK